MGKGGSRNQVSQFLMQNRSLLCDSFKKKMYCLNKDILYSLNCIPVIFLDLVSNTNLFKRYCFEQHFLFFLDLMIFCIISLHMNTRLEIIMALYPKKVIITECR